MTKIIDLPTTASTDANTFVPVYKNGKTQKVSATVFGGGGSGGLSADFTSLSSVATVDGTEIVPVNKPTGTILKTTTQAILNWILARANSWTGRQTFRDYRETVVTANTTSTYSINLSSGTLFDLTLTANCTYTFPSSPVSGLQFILMQKQDATGSRTVTWPSNVRWAGGTAPTPTATASRTDVFTFIYEGTYWLGFVGGQNYTRA